LTRFPQNHVFAPIKVQSDRTRKTTTNLRVPHVSPFETWDSPPNLSPGGAPDNSPGRKSWVKQKKDSGPAGTHEPSRPELLTNEDEILIRIKIVLARLVDHSQLMPFGRPLISQHPVDFPQLQTSRIALVPHAKDEPCPTPLRVIRQSVRSHVRGKGTTSVVPQKTRKKTQAPQTRRTGQKADRPLTSLPIPPRPCESSPK